MTKLTLNISIDANSVNKRHIMDINTANNRRNMYIYHLFEAVAPLKNAFIDSDLRSSEACSARCEEMVCHTGPAFLLAL